MTAELVEKITQAERLASEEKEQAASRAEEIVKEAEFRAKNTLSSAEGVCKAYFDTQIRLATAQSEKRFEETLKEAKKEASEQAKRATGGAESSIGEIVARIVRGEAQG